LQLIILASHFDLQKIFSIARKIFDNPWVKIASFSIDLRYYFLLAKAKTLGEQ